MSTDQSEFDAARAAQCLTEFYQLIDQATKMRVFFAWNEDAMEAVRTRLRRERPELTGLDFANEVGRFVDENPRWASLDELKRYL